MDEEPSRKDTFKNAGTADAGRKRRQTQRVTLRARAREEMLTKRRVAVGQPSEDSNEPSEEQHLPGIVELMKTGSAEEKLTAVSRLRRILSLQHAPPVENVIQLGAVPILMEFLIAFDSPTLQFEAAWSLTNIASGTSDHTKAVINAGAIPVFVRLISSPAENVREQAVWALGNIAGDHAKYRDQVLHLGALELLLRILLLTDKIAQVRNATWALSNFCRSKPIPQFHHVAPALPTLGRLILHDDSEVATDACWAISYLSDGPPDRIDAVIQAGVVSNLVTMLSVSSPVQVPALRTIGNIVTGSDDQTHVALTHGLLSVLPFLLASERKNTRKEACWIISNIAAGNQHQIQQLLEHKVFPPLIGLLSSGEFDIRKEAAYAVSNATHGGSCEQIETLVRLGCVPPLCNLLKAPDPKVVAVALESVKYILASGEGRDSSNGNAYVNLIVDSNGHTFMEDLQNHQLEEIFASAQEILEKFFDCEERGDTQAEFTQPPAPQSEFNFS